MKDGIQNTMSTGLKCDKCDMEFDDKARLERHKQVHGRKPKMVEAGGIDFDQVGA